MKSLVALCLLVALTTQGAVLIPSRASFARGPTRASLVIGNVGVGDALLFRTRVTRSAIYNAVQSEDVVYRGNSTTNLTAIFATEQGYTQYGTAYLLSGGVGRNNATVRLQSARSWGYDYLVDFWGRTRR